MNARQKLLLTSVLLAAAAPLAWADKEVVVRRIDIDSPHHGPGPREDEMEKENVTFLGIETAPVGRTLSAQLGLPRETGLVVTHVMEKSPAADQLKEDDVLLRLDDQVLINIQQLAVLVRSHKDGDEVKLTVVRSGKEMTVKVKLATHEVPKRGRGDAFFFQNRGPGGFNWEGGLPPEALAGLDRLRDVPGMGDEHARDVMRMIGRERGAFLAGPDVRVFRHKGPGATILDLPKSNISYSDDDGSIDIKVDDGKRNLTVKDAKGKVVFQGPINTEEERKQLPPEAMKRLEKLDNDTFEFEVGNDFKPEVVPLPAAGKAKISHSLDGDQRASQSRDSAPF